MRLTIASNNGDIGGGEMMLRHLALAAREAGHDVTIVAPAQPADVISRAAEDGFAHVAIGGGDRPTYLRNLRRWDHAERRGLLWCNGLVPGLATAGHRDRVLHLHQVPQSRAQWAATHPAALGTRAVVVPSQTMADRIVRSRGVAGIRPLVLWNWSEPFPLVARRATSGPAVVGFLGRATARKGLDVLAHAVAELDRRRPGGARLLIAGEPRFADADDQRRVDTALAPIAPLVDRAGWLSPTAFYGAVDVAVFPSIQAETFGLVVAEAQYAGCPFVVSDAGALPEVAGPDHPWVAPAGDATALASMIDRALSGTDQAMLDAARLRWEANFSPEAGRARLAALLTTFDTTDN